MSSQIVGDPASTLPDGTEPTAPVPTAPRTFTAEEVERFRAQERGKLNQQLEETRSQLAVVTEKLTGWEAQQAELRTAAEAAQAAQAEADRKAREEELSARELIRVKEQEWEQRFNTLQTEREQERAVMAREQEFVQLQAYIQKRVREESDKIAPELLDLVTGNNPDEVEASINVLKAKTESIFTNMSAAAAGAQPQLPPRGVSPAGYAAHGPLENESVQQSLTPDALRQMSMAEYAKVRGQLLGQSAQPTRGLFG